MNCIKKGKYTGDSCFGCEIKIGDCEIRDKVYRQRWILVSERLPEEDGTYLVAWLQRGCKSLCDYPHYYGMFEFTDGGFDIDVPAGFNGYEIIILAWQPLPEPYKEGR